MGLFKSASKIPPDMFTMWRCVIVIAHADGTVSEEEHAYLEKVFAAIGARYGLTEEQKATFADDLQNPQDLNELLPQIKLPEYRAMLISFGEILAHADGVVSPEEEEILQRLSAHAEGLDVESLRQEIRKSIADNRAAMAREDEKTRQETHTRNLFISPVIATLDNFLRKHFKLDIEFD